MSFSSLAEAAMAYALAGLKVFPLKPGTKTPITENGHLAATSDPDQVAAWWAQNSNANIGLPCEFNTLVVIDLDRHPGKEDGLTAFYELMSDYPLPDCPTVRTGGGGLHLFFKHPGVSIKGKIQNGIDIKSAGYVVLPPSIHPDGPIYEWEGDANDLLATLSNLPPMPDWLLEHCQKDSTAVPADNVSNADFLPSNPESIQKRCGFIQYWVEQADKLSEPDWYQGIGVLAYTVEADAFIHQHSSRYPGYSQKETQAKIEQWRQNAHGPATCEAIQTQCGELQCLGCPYKGHIKSPITLGSILQSRQQLDKPWPFPVDVLPKLFKDFTEAGAASLSCPPDYIACSLLVCASLVIGRSRKVQITSEWQMLANLWIALVGRPASKKSPAFELVTRFLNAIQTTEVEAYKARKLQYEIAKEQYDRDMNMQRNHKTIDPPVKPSEPIPLKRLTTSDATVEALCVLLASNPFGLGVFNDELSILFRSMNQYKGGHGTDRSHYLGMWNAARIEIDRKTQNKEPVVVPEPFLSILGGIQPDILNEIRMGNGMAMHDGMLERFLYSMPESSYIPIEDERPIPNTLKVALARCFENIYRLRETAEIPLVVQLSDEAKDLFLKVQDESYQKIYDPDFDKALEAFLLKMLTYRARFSLILQTIKQVTGESQSQVIELETMEQANRLADYFLNHAEHALNLMLISTQGKRIQNVVAWIQRKGLSIVTSRDLLTGKVLGCETSAEAQALLKRLHDYGQGYWNPHSKRFIPYVE